MPIMKKKVYENFTVVDNYYIDDIECKPECMGYLTYMLRKPENWNFTFKSIMKDLGVGERNVRTNIQRLEALKYIKRERSRDENGNFIWIYYIYNKPYDLDLNKENLPYVRFGHVDGEHIQTDQIIINTNNNKDKKDKTAEAEIIPDEINHNKLTEELINLKYIDEKDQMRPFYFDNLFNEYLLAGRKYVELFSRIHYIVPRVISNGFKDENGNDIKNRFAYFKSALESNFSKLENLGKDLYPDDDSLWKDFETNKVKDMAWMFYGCYNLRTIYASDNFVTNNVTLSTSMFYGDSNLKGGNGTLYNSGYRDKTYARIDKEETPGYFTLKSA